MQEIIKEYGEAIAGAVAVAAVLGLFAFVFLSRNGIFHNILISFCGYLL